MIAQAEKKQIAKELQARINAMQGLGKTSDLKKLDGLELFAPAFPEGIFPTGTLHEFISYESTAAASTVGFITSLVSKLMKDGGVCLWITTERKTFTKGCIHFGIEPDRIVFIYVQKAKDALWIIEEALKCEALTTVISEIKELSFTDSRRFQLAVERSGVTSFVHRFCPFSENATASTTRWSITPLPSSSVDGLPGIGYPCWNVQLVKVRNGKPSSWNVNWSGTNFISIDEKTLALSKQRNAV